VTIAVLDAPSNLGLRPPAPGTVPGCYKAPGALRDTGLVPRLGARDAGHVIAPRYDLDGWQPGDGVFNAAGIASYSSKLADRLGPLIDAREFALVLGGDCSIVLGAGLALRRRQGRYGLVYMDGHSDFRHVGNESHVGAAAGEDLAIVTGRGQPDLADLEELGPLFREQDVVLLGIREDDDYRDELASAGVALRTSPAIQKHGAPQTAAWAVDHLSGLDGFWAHVDVDILDPTVVSAVDSPDPGGLRADELAGLLGGLVAAPGCLGLQVTVYDPDLDQDGTQAAILADILVAALTQAGRAR
jgi:arginase